MGAEVSRLHPCRWPLAVWTLATVAIAFLRVDYTLAGSFSFAPAMALLSGTWLGSRRGALVQILATAVLIPLAMLSPATVRPGEWGYRVGLVVSAALAGVIASPDDDGARPPRAVRLTVFGVAGATAALAMVFLPQTSRDAVGILFVLTFLLAPVFAVFYAYKMVSEPGRVVGYFFCLLPYYAAGFAGNALLARWSPNTAAAAGIPDGLKEILFQSYFSHLPGELMSLVVIAYLVCAIDRQGTAGESLAIDESR